MRLFISATLLLLILAPAVRADKLYDEYVNDASKKSELVKGRKLVAKFLELDRVSRGGGRNAGRAMGKRVDALEDVMVWLAETETTLGKDLRKHYPTVLRLISEAREKEFATKFTKNAIKYIQNPDARGVDRFDYALWVPRSYAYKGKNRGAMKPAIIALHGRAIDQRHPAYRSGDPSERGRKPIYNNWLKHPAAETALVIAPTGDPKGFRFADDANTDNTNQMFHALRTILGNFRVDWNRVFLDVEGSAIRVACQYPSLFAGIIVRDYIEDRRSPGLPPEEWCILDNLNGLPLIYVADDKNWEKVGKPFSEALTAAYKKNNAEGSLMILRAKRDSNEALRSEDKKVAQFIDKNRRRKRLDKFQWRFFNRYLVSPLPVDITSANYSYDLDQPLEKTAGSLTYKYSTDGKTNLIEIDVTEAEALNVNLHDDVAHLDLPITIKVNGHILKENVTVKRDWRTFFDRMVSTNMLMIPYLSSISVTFPSVAQFKEETPEGTEKADDTEKENAGNGDAEKSKDTEKAGAGEEKAGVKDR